MICRGIGLAAVIWIAGATAAWAGAPRAVDGPVTVQEPAACTSCPHHLCWHSLCGWFTYCPAPCGCLCHLNCTAYPPLYTFFLEYNGDGGPVYSPAPPNPYCPSSKACSHSKCASCGKAGSKHCQP